MHGPTTGTNSSSCTFVSFTANVTIFIIFTHLICPSNLPAPMWTCSGTGGQVLRCSFLESCRNNKTMPNSVIPFCKPRVSCVSYLKVLNSEGNKKKNQPFFFFSLLLFVKVSQSQPTVASLQLSVPTCLRSCQPPRLLHRVRSARSSSRL